MSKKNFEENKESEVQLEPEEETTPLAIRAVVAQELEVAKEEIEALKKINALLGQELLNERKSKKELQGRYDALWDGYVRSRP